jgi:hypothetical protein
MAVARVTEIVASSAKGFQEAVQEGFKRATKTLRGITGIEITRFQVKVDDNKMKEYRVHMTVTFVLEE